MYHLVYHQLRLWFETGEMGQLSITIYRSTVKPFSTDFYYTFSIITRCLIGVDPKWL
jgi:hypothetical protein